MRQNYEMTEDDLDKLLVACQPVPMIALQCGAPRSKYENVNAAWVELGKRMHFDPATVLPTGKGYRLFSAVPIEPNLQMDGDSWCATWPDFDSLQVSPSGFGDTQEEAVANLLKDTE